MLNASEKRAEEELLPDLSWTGGGVWGFIIRDAR
jgi:hypothetical protein